MEMQQVEYFLAICAERNFTRAARRCGIAQPTLSIAIKQLERECGGQLFVRGRAGVWLTPLAAAVRPHLAQIERSTRKALGVATASSQCRSPLRVRQ